MDIFYDTEVVFTDTFAAKPVKTLKVETTAPISVSATIPNSSGVVSFTGNDTFSDRFIVWRAIGQKLYLEERSLCRTILNGSLCLEFTRTAIVPGTAIFLEQSLLCIVVPTQSSVHRFYLRLIGNPLDAVSTEANSIFTQIHDREFLVEKHCSHILTTNGTALRAAVLHNAGHTKVAYSMAEGMIVVSMPGLNPEEYTEAPCREGGFISRIIGGSPSRDVIADVTAHQNGPHSAFYSAYKDGMIRGWPENGNGTAHSYNLRNTYMVGAFDIQAENQLLIKTIDGERNEVFVIVAVSNGNSINIHFLRDQNRKFFYLSCIAVDESGGDYRLHLLTKTATSTSVDYKFCYAPVYIKKNAVSLLSAWKLVQPPYARPFANNDMSVQELRDYIFNADIHPFEMVYRAIQIQCGGKCEAAMGNWKALTEYLDAYLRSPEFDSRTQRRKSAGRQSIHDRRSESEKNFLVVLASSIEQLMVAARSGLGVFMLDLPGACLTGVITEDRFSTICPMDSQIKELKLEQNDKLLENLRGREGRMESSDEDSSDEYYDSLPELSQKDMRRWTKNIATFIDLLRKDVIPDQGKLGKAEFSGSFTSGMVSAFVQHQARTRHQFTAILIRVASAIQAQRNTDCVALDSHDWKQMYALHSELERTEQLLRQLLEQFMIMINRSGALSSLVSWALTSNDLSLFRCEGGACKVDGDITMDSADQDDNGIEYNSLVLQTAEAAFRSFWPRSKTLIICRLLAEHRQFVALKSLCSNYLDNGLAEQAPAIRFYIAVAYSGLQQPHKAMIAFNEAVSGIDEKNEALQRALRPIGASLETPASLGEFYTTAIRYLHEHGHSDEVVELSKTAINNVRDGDECTGRIYATLFNHLVEKADWLEALETVSKNKDLEMRTITLKDLMSRLLMAKDYATIAKLPYGDLEDQVEDILLTHAKVQDVEASPHLYEVIYAFHMARDDLARAARTMYCFAMLLEQSTQNYDLFRRRRDVLAAVACILDLLPEEERYAWYSQEYVDQSDADALVPETAEAMDVIDGNPGQRIRRKIVIVNEKTLADKWIIADARFTLLERLREIPPTEPKEIVDELIKVFEFDKAFDVCRQCDISVDKVLAAAARETLMISFLGLQVTPEWVLQNRGHIVDRSNDHWAIVRGLLSAAQQEWPTDSRPLRAVVCTFLSHGVAVPCWLQTLYIDQDIGDYVRCLVDYDALGESMKIMTEHIDRETRKITSCEPALTCLPFTVISELVKLAAKHEEQELISNLNTALKTYLGRVNSFETAARLS